MKIYLKVYYIDSKGKFYCFKHAVEEKEQKIQSEVEDSEHAFNYPQCCKCGDFV